MFNRKLNSLIKVIKNSEGGIEKRLGELKWTSDFTHHTISYSSTGTAMTSKPYRKISAVELLILKTTTGNK